MFIVLGLVLLNGVFAGAEIAIVSVRRTRLTELAEEGHRGAHAVLRLRGNPDRFFASVQIGITIVGSTAAAIGGADIAGEFAPVLQGIGLDPVWANRLALAGVVGGISYLSLVLGELVPKSLGLRFSEAYALMIARPLLGLAKLAGPLVWLLTFSSNLVLRFFGDRTTFSEARMSAEELQALVEDAAKHGSVDTHTSEIASRAFELKDIPVSAVMVPRGRIVSIDKDADFEEVKAVILEEGHSRFPVKDETVDNIVGYILAKDLLAIQWESNLFRLDDLLRPPFFIPETMRALDALREMQRRGLQLAIVVDERGAVGGLVTVEDLLEELVGEIFSEGEIPVEVARREADGAYVVAGAAAVRDVNRATGLELPEEDGYSTVAGLTISEAGHIPQAGEEFTLDDGTRLQVCDASPRRIRALRIYPPPPAQGDEEETSAAAEAGGERLPQ